LRRGASEKSLSSQLGLTVVAGGEVDVVALVVAGGEVDVVALVVVGCVLDVVALVVDVVALVVVGGVLDVVALVVGCVSGPLESAHEERTSRTSVMAVA
jgi:hypothetical protein